MSNVPSDPPVTIVKPTVASFLIANAVRFAVPAIAAFGVSLLAKAGFHLSVADAVGYIGVPVGAALSALAKLIEAKVPWLGRILLAKKPQAL